VSSTQKAVVGQPSAKGRDLLNRERRSCRDRHTTQGGDSWAEDVAACSQGLSCVGCSRHQRTGHPADRWQQQRSPVCQPIRHDGAWHARSNARSDAEEVSKKSLSRHILFANALTARISSRPLNCHFTPTQPTKGPLLRLLAHLSYQISILRQGDTPLTRLFCFVEQQI
jgi:hypothetical protein